MSNAMQIQSSAPATEEPAVRIRGLQKWFGTNHVLRGIDLDIQSGQTVAVMGSSGAGKSTMLRSINLLEQPDTGSIEVGGVMLGVERARGGRWRRLPEAKVAVQRRRVGMVFQNFNLFPNWTVLRNIADGPHSQLGVSRAESAERARRWLERVGLLDREASYPGQLSGGQQQRVAIARALAMDPLVLLLDEPTSALDPENVGEVVDVMATLAASGTTMVVVTHELHFARRSADRIIFMADGLIVQDSPPEEFFASDHPKVRAFLRGTDTTQESAA